MTRWALTILGLLHLAWGIPATVAPRWFFDHFPGFGHRWTAAYPPYNEHLMTDVGAAFTTLGVILLLAAWMMDRKVTIVVLIGLLVFSTIHLGYHALHRGGLHAVDLAASIASLVAGVIVPLALLLLTLSRR